MAEGLIQSIGRMMAERGIMRHEPEGWEYYSGYGANLYDWELFFDAICLSYYNRGDLALNSLRWYLSVVRKDGFLPRSLRPNEPAGSPWSVFEDEEHCKPFLCQTALALMRVNGSTTWFTAEDYHRLRSYLDYWLIDLDRDSSGLSEWNSGPHSGCDTQFARIGPWRSCYCEGVDLNCYLYRELLAAAELAGYLGLEDEAARCRLQAGVKRERIRALLWDAREGFFYDRDIRTGNKINVKSAAAFLTLWAGVADQEQADLLVRRHLTNESEFWPPCPVASYARTEPDYTQRYIPVPGADPALLAEGHANWCGGMWPHWNYLIAHGLADYGYHDAAARVAASLYSAVAADPELHEWYDAETGKGCGMHPFYAGATALGAMLPTELKLRFNPMALGNPMDQLDIASIRLVLGSGV
ncbi:MAG: MGH1-like glycoside hydrolase domain-containing protein [Anaerolineae bacterium]